MNDLAPKHPATTDSFAEEELVRLQLQVARRADELSARTSPGQDKDLERWLQAEREVLAHNRQRVSSPAAASR